MATSPKQTTIRIDRVTAAALERKAAARGLSLQAYLQAIAGNGAEAHVDRQNATAAAEDFDRTLDEFFLQNPRKLPPLPADFSRVDLYPDHD